MLRFLSKFKPCNDDGVERAIMLTCPADPRKYLGERMPNSEAQNAIADALGIPHEDIGQLIEEVERQRTSEGADESIYIENCPF